MIVTGSQPVDVFGGEHVVRRRSDVVEGKGRLRIGTTMEAEMEPYKGATGMDANLGKQIGSSRITCALSVLRHLGTMTGSQPTDDANVVWTL